MISICIPIYNQDIRILVDTIVDQCKMEDVEFQVLCFDDFSLPEFKEINQEVALKLNVNYTELSENVGRAKIRNKMAKLARYDFMLFLDGDSGIEDDNFIANYVKWIYKTHIVFGGRIYESSPPEKDFKLHWEYGRKVESQIANKRSRHPYRSFMSNNFLVTKEVMFKIPFDESISSYGYEDLEWAENAKKNGYHILHINNPVIHLGLESSTKFIQKTETSIENLVALFQAGKVRNTRILKWRSFIKSIGLSKLITAVLKTGHDKRKAKLEKGKVSLFTLQMFKLYLLLDQLD